MTCPKFGFNHDMGHCSCNPNYELPGYCQWCYTALMPFKRDTDWGSRKYHKKCWKEIKQKYDEKCDECGQIINEILDNFCECMV